MSLGTGFIDIRPDLRGFGTEMYAGLRGVDTKRGGSHLGGRLAAATGVALKTGVKVAGGIAAGALSAALFSGFKRLNDIDIAKKKLEGLGHSTKEVDNIMKSALASVKGTAFGLGDAASIAASTVAAGVKPGKELTYTLKNVADAAAISGASLSDMGQIFNKVAAVGHVTGREINQLGIRGIPILQLLGKQFGKTPAEIQKMVSAGKVSFKDFQKAMHDGLAGSALKSGETVRGAFANMLAALSRVGAGLLSGVFPLFRKSFAGINALLDKMQPLADAAGKALGVGVKRAADAIGGLIKTLQGGDVNRTSFVQTLRGVADWINKHILPSVRNLTDAISERFDKLGAIARQFVNGMMKRLRPLMPQIREIFKLIGQIVGAAMDLLAVLIRRGTDLVVFIWKHFGRQIMDVVGAVFKAIVPIVRAALKIIVNIVKFVTAVLKGDWSGAWKAMKGAVKAQWDLIKAVVKGALHILVALLKLNIAIIKKLWQAANHFIGWAWDKTWNGIKATVRFVWEHIIRPIFRHIADAFLKMAGIVIHGAARMFGWVPGVGGKLKSAARRFDDFRDKVNRALSGIHDRKVDVTAQWGNKFQTLVNISGKKYRVGGVTHLAAGGPVRGPGTGTSDDVPIMASNGEHMWTAREVMAAGGHAAMRAMRKAVLRGYAVGGEISVRPATRTAGLGHDMSVLDRVVRRAATNIGLSGANALGIFGYGSAGNVSGGVKRWSGVVLRVLALLHQSASWLGTVLARMQRESGGNPRAINLRDVNAQRGDPSRGLMQTIGSTFNAYAGPFRGLGIYNPLANVYAGLNYALRRYGSLGALSRPGGYDSGGMLNPGRLGINGTGRPERVLSPRQTQAFEELVALLQSGGAAGGPRELVVKDINGDLIGRMQVEAGNVIDQEIRSARLGGY